MTSFFDKFPICWTFVTITNKALINILVYSLRQNQFALGFISGNRIHSFSLHVANMPSGSDRTSLHSQELGVIFPFYWLHHHQHWVISGLGNFQVLFFFKLGTIQAVTSKNKGIRKTEQLELWAEPWSVSQELGPWYLVIVTVSLSLREPHP